MAHLTTWELMQKYNAPAPGSHIRVKSYLSSYVKVGGEYQVGWDSTGYNPLGDPYLSNLNSGGGTSCSLWDFERCDWEYVYTHCNKPNLKWPRAEYVKRELA